MTGALLRVDIRGREGRTLGEAWEGGPRTYLGLSVAGFPNLFTITGPGSPSVLANMIVAIEQHVDWIAQCMTDLRERGLDTIEATLEAQDGWVQHVNEAADGTLWPQANCLGTWEPTFQAKPACSCPTSEGSTSTPRSAWRSSPTATKASSWQPPHRWPQPHSPRLEGVAHDLALADHERQHGLRPREGSEVPQRVDVAQHDVGRSAGGQSAESAPPAHRAVR